MAIAGLFDVVPTVEEANERERFFREFAAERGHPPCAWADTAYDRGIRTCPECGSREVDIDGSGCYSCGWPGEILGYTLLRIRERGNTRDSFAHLDREAEEAWLTSRA